MTFFADLLICLRFFTRLPVPATARERQLGSRGLAAAMLMVPLAGLVLALPSVGILWVSSSAGLPFFLAATLSLAAAIMLTGALHEDALADCADGFGGGRTRERKLAIMRDSTIGTYGATALVLSLLLRTSAIAAAASQGRGGTALMVAATLSRAACFAPLATLAPARNEGRGAAVRVCSRPFAFVCVIAAVLAVAVAVATHSGVARALVAVLAAVIGTSAFTTIAWRQIGGQTGDVAGGAQQAAEMAVLLVYATGGT